MRNQARRVRLLAVTAVLAACTDADPRPAVGDAGSSSLLPMAIHGMPLTGVTAGAEAEALIGRLHGKDVAPLASYVGHYRGGGAEATLYVSRLSDAVAADSLVVRMAESIGSGNRTFAHHARFQVGDVPVHAVLGQGQAHFFYARGPDVAWLGIDRHMARVGLADLLGLEVERVPAGVVIGDVDILPPPDSLYRREYPANARDARR